MKTSICFLNDKILVLKGAVSNKTVKVVGYDTFRLREGSVINGVITDTSNIREVLNVIKSDKNLFSKDVSVILDSNLIHTKIASAPLVNQNKLLIAAKNEFANMENPDNDFAFDYSVISPKNKDNNCTILCYAVQKSMIKSYLELFSDIKVKLECIDASVNSIINYTLSIDTLKNKSYILMYLNQNNLSSYMFIKNKFYYSTRARLINEIKSTAYISEIVSQISTMLQFNKSQKNGEDINEVYISGLTNDTYIRMEPLIKDLGISVFPATQFKSNLKIKRNLDFYNSDEFIYNIGCLLGK